MIREIKPEVISPFSITLKISFNQPLAVPVSFRVIRIHRSFQDESLRGPVLSFYGNHLVKNTSL